jgi:hypothetical protein
MLTLLRYYFNYYNSNSFADGFPGTPLPALPRQAGRLGFSAVQVCQCSLA